FVCSVKCFRKSTKCTSFIHPDGFAAPLLPGGPLFKKWSRKLTRGNMKYGGILFPVADTAQASVTSVPLSAEVSDPTCLNPRLATTLSGLWTVVTPVSSTFHMSPGPNRCLSSTFAKLSKKALTFSRLKLLALARLVASGFLIDSIGCLFKKAVNHSELAFSVSAHVGVNFSLCATANW
ncbi:hypothetical protein AAFF_G00182790, partial [Aldrovandia affinis]